MSSGYKHVGAEGFAVRVSEFGVGFHLGPDRLVPLPLVLEARRYNCGSNWVEFALKVKTLPLLASLLLAFLSYGLFFRRASKSKVTFRPGFKTHYIIPITGNEAKTHRPFSSVPPKF